MFSLMRLRLLLTAMYQGADQDPQEQGLQEHPELPQQVALQEEVPPSTQGPPGPTRSDSDAPGTIQQEPQQQVGAFSPINTPTKMQDPQLLVGGSRRIFWRVGGPERSALDPWAWRRARVQFCVTACGQCVRIREGRHCFRRLACTCRRGCRRCRCRAEASQTRLLPSGGILERRGEQEISSREQAATH